MNARERKHLGAAETHRSAAKRHEEAFAYWGERGDTERAHLEQRAADIERQMAQLEQDRAELEMRRLPRTPDSD
jgi:hypothetical protein